MPACCGVHVFTGFGHTAHAARYEQKSRKEIEKFLDDSEEECRANDLAMVVCTLNDDQMRAIGESFKKKKWRVLYDGYHPNHDSIIYLLAKKLHNTPANRR